MKKSKLFLLLLLFSLSIFITGCNNTEKEENLLLSEKITTIFEKEAEKETDIKTIADNLSRNEMFEIKLQVTEIKTGDYLSGFEGEIGGYSKAVVIQPMIGTIPFIMYIFESDTPSELVSILESKANLNWNICTQADEKKSSIKDNLVFFIMNPTSFEE